jgi:hypothetical protein
VAAIDCDRIAKGMVGPCPRSRATAQQGSAAMMRTG